MKIEKHPLSCIHCYRETEFTCVCGARVCPQHSWTRVMRRGAEIVTADLCRGCRDAQIASEAA